MTPNSLPETIKTNNNNNKSKKPQQNQKRRARNGGACLQFNAWKVKVGGSGFKLA